VGSRQLGLARKRAGAKKKETGVKEGLESEKAEQTSYFSSSNRIKRNKEKTSAGSKTLEPEEKGGNQHTGL